MNITLFNNGNYAHVKGDGLDYWWSTQTNTVIPKNNIQSMVLAKDSTILGCALLCAGEAYTCSDEALLSNAYDCLLANNSDALESN